MLKIERLALAMAEQEGWLPPGWTVIPGGSRSYRNHNPLNLRASPFLHTMQDSFCCFVSDEDGWAAARWDIVQKCKGNTHTGLGPDSTLRQLIHVWAPESDGNDPEAYLTAVLTRTGFTANMKLSELLNA